MKDDRSPLMQPARQRTSASAELLLRALMLQDVSQAEDVETDQLRQAT
jgi:hypothetical protein